jgi:hypothetical protein
LLLCCTGLAFSMGSPFLCMADACHGWADMLADWLYRYLQDLGDYPELKPTVHIVKSEGKATLSLHRCATFLSFHLPCSGHRQRGSRAVQEGRGAGRRLPGAGQPQQRKDCGVLPRIRHSVLCPSLDQTGSNRALVVEVHRQRLVGGWVAYSSYQPPAYQIT